MMSEGWYDIVDASVPVTQGDIIFDCPLISWQPSPIELQGEQLAEVLKDTVISTLADVVVLTQACDLEQHKVDHIILCPHHTLGEYQMLWEEEMRSRKQNITTRSWKSHCKDICDGFIWNLTMLNNFEMNEHTIDIRIVDFHYVYTVPRIFLESLLAQRNKKRFRLLPPYREHISQAFARFFMRVGLPVDIKEDW